MQGKRIAIVTPYGAEPRYDNYAEFILAQVLRERGWDTRLYTYAMRGKPSYTKDFIYRTVPTIRCRERLALSPKLFFSILIFRPRIVICFHPKNLLTFTAMLASRCVGARFIVEVVGLLHDPYIVEDVDDPVRTLRKEPHLVTNIAQLLRDARREGFLSGWKNYVLHAPTAHADIVIAINKYEQEGIRRIYGREAQCIYYATPRETEIVEERPSQSRKDIHEGFLFFIGQIKRRKGWDVALSALAHLKSVGHPAHLVFVAPEADLSEPLEYARRHGITDSVTFLSGISNEEKHWLYAHARYVLVPSTYEGFGLPVFEAFLAGKPVCATDIPVFREFLIQEKNAMLSPVGDGAGLARSIMKLDANPALQKRLRDGGRRTAQDFNYERMVEAHLRVIT